MTTLAEASAAMYSRPVVHAPPDPLDGVRAELDRLALLAPAAGVARGLLDVHGMPCLPIDRDSQQPTAEAFRSLDDVARHYRGNPSDGLALLAGQHPGRTVVAVRATPPAWRQFLADRCVDVRPITNDEGRQVAEDRVLRDLGRPALVSWTPPPAPPTRSVSALGGAALMRAADDLLHGSARAQAARPLLVCWSAEVVWSVETDGARQVSFARPRRPLAPGVELIVDGPIPWALEADHGWTLVASPLMTAPLPEHLVDALGGRWAAPVAAGAVQ